MKKILVAAGIYPPDIGGPATYAKMLEVELPKAGIETVVIPFGTVRHLPKVFRHMVFMWALLKQAKKCDALYALDPVSVGLPALMVSRITNKPFLIRLGGDYAWEQGRIRCGLTSTLDEYTVDPKNRPIRVRLLAAVQSYVVKRALFVVSPSEYLKRIILTWGVKEERVKVIYSALFPLPITESREVIRKRLSYDGVVLVTAARLTPWKGVHVLIDVLKELIEEIPEISLVIAGDGEARASLEKQAKALDVDHKVRFVGKLSKEALGAAIKGADLFVYNTSYEGLPHQLLEVMDLGVPIVTTSIPGNREILTDGVEALLVDPDDTAELIVSIKRVLQNEQLHDRLTQNARLRSKDFIQESVRTKLIELLDEVVL
ncbi:glycosyltransferase family 4 protein [Candidatus Pacebacteria bacterium]|nr:glycosyltransferase family 4 protein [Candidatus Paceibacterota bacterium]